MAYGMVTIYGMNAAIGNVSFNDTNQEYGFTKPYSEKTAEMIDHEVRLIIDACYQKTKVLLLEKKDKLEELSKILLKKEILFQHDFEEILGKRPHDKVEEVIEATIVDATVIEDTEAVLMPIDPTVPSSTEE
jgi:cell division protease FtsH